MKYDAALHYRFNPNLELSYAYRFGGGNTVYQGSEKYALRDFTQQFHKVELRGKNFFIRGYNTRTDAGNSYNMSALGAFVNEGYAPSASQWVPDYVTAFYGLVPGYDPGHEGARAYADRNRPAPGTPAFKTLVESVRNNYFQRNPPGAKFIDNSRLYHAEFNYRFDDMITWAEVQIGGNFRRYDLFSDATVYNEDPDGDSKASRITIDEYGAYLQVAKELGKLKLTGSIRHDKNQNFDGLWTPRLSAVFSASENSFFRASFQTGFRNPDTQAQYIYFPTGSGILLGSTKDNAERYGVHNGGAYTESSWLAYRESGGGIDGSTGALIGGNQSLLETANIPYIKPEKLQSVEVGYKGSFNKRLLVDAYVFYNTYKNFIGDQLVYSKLPTTHKGTTVPAGTLWAPYVNSPEQITSLGSGVNLSYTFLKGYVATANYTFQNYDANEEEFIAGFNTPENKIMVGLSNRNINNTGFGFNLNYRWQEAFMWNSGFGNWNVPEYGVFDAMLSYQLTSMKATLKLGGTNLLGGDYRPNFGSSFVGQQYYLSITFDELFK